MQILVVTIFMERSQDAHHSPEPVLALDYNASGGTLAVPSPLSFLISKGDLSIAIIATDYPVLVKCL